MTPNVGAGQVRSTFLSFSTNAWVFSVVLILALISVSLRPPALLPVPILVVAVLAWPRLRTWRTGTFVMLVALWGVALIPGSPLHRSTWSALFGALTILAAETARGEGVGAPIARFLQSPRVQGWAALILLPPIGVFGVLGVDRELQRSGVPSSWRWSLVGLVVLMLVPLGRAGNFVRALPAIFLTPIAFLNSVGSTPETSPADMVTAKHLYDAATGSVQCLFLAFWAHEGLAKLRPGRTSSPVKPGSDPIRVHSGVERP